MTVPPEAELCIATYLVQRISGHVLIFATGVHHVSGCVVFFHREPGAEFPPRFSLWHLRPNEPALHALTPFSAWTSFQTTHDVDRVLILDASGSHVVSARDVPEPALSHIP